MAYDDLRRFRPKLCSTLIETSIPTDQISVRRQSVPTPPLSLSLTHTRFKTKEHFLLRCYSKIADLVSSFAHNLESNTPRHGGLHRQTRIIATKIRYCCFTIRLKPTNLLSQTEPKSIPQPVDTMGSGGWRERERGVTVVNWELPRIAARLLGADFGRLAQQNLLREEMPRLFEMLLSMTKDVHLGRLGKNGARCFLVVAALVAAPKHVSRVIQLGPRVLDKKSDVSAHCRFCCVSLPELVVSAFWVTSSYN